MNLNDCIEHEEQLSGKEITFQGLRWQYGTYRSVLEGVDRFGHKKYRGRSGVQTELGDIENSLWCALVHRLITESGEEELFVALKKWVTEHCKWLKNEREIEESALKAHCLRVFENPNWVDYEAFRQKQEEII